MGHLSRPSWRPVLGRYIRDCAQTVSTRVQNCTSPRSPLFLAKYGREPAASCLLQRTGCWNNTDSWEFYRCRARRRQHPRRLQRCRVQEARRTAAPNRNPRAPHHQWGIRFQCVIVCDGRNFSCHRRLSFHPYHGEQGMQDQSISLQYKELMDNIE